MYVDVHWWCYTGDLITPRFNHVVIYTPDE